MSNPRFISDLNEREQRILLLLIENKGLRLNQSGLVSKLKMKMTTFRYYLKRLISLGYNIKIENEWVSIDNKRNKGGMLKSPRKYIWVEK